MNRRTDAGRGTADRDETRKSKSQRRREALALQSVAESLTALTPSDRARVPMWPELDAAVADARGLRRVALRRQVRRIARLLREGDPAPVVRALDAVRRPGRREAARHRRIERLRDAMVRGEMSADDMRAAAPALDFQRLRHLVAAARRERDDARESASERHLFRFLRDYGADLLNVVDADGGAPGHDTPARQRPKDPTEDR